MISDEKVIVTLLSTYVFCLPTFTATEDSH